jgi:Carboxypeptidase regulatory-like domain
MFSPVISSITSLIAERMLMNTVLNNIRVASPCPASWEKMTGDDRVRYCQECKLNVYNLSEMTRLEAERLIANREHRLCVRYYRRTDGTILTRDCPEGLQARVRRISRIAGAALSAIIGAGLAALTPMASAVQGRPLQNPQQPAIWMVVLDPNGATIHNARITLLDERSQKTMSTVSDADGKASFSSLTAGSYTLSISAPGFEANRQTVQLAVQAVSLKITLRIAALQGDVAVVTPLAIPTEDVRVDPIPPYPIHPVKENKKR